MEQGMGGEFRWAAVLSCWVAVKELKLSYHNPETTLFTIYPYYAKLNVSSLTAGQLVSPALPKNAL